ncbi:hypothetical protein QWJ90_11985 [Microbacterium oryzae]|uniref:hypothetical protein n=1 Tax=Microbacterium oryzae TaxID=743009 RepID=UPI0025B24E5B|nr:hypothetical protein [Microbacterium oryzae]MDN3311651.1 hypothetical protein [Microbacterium oryzae]
MTWMDWLLLAVLGGAALGLLLWGILRDRRAEQQPGDELPPHENQRAQYDADIARMRAAHRYTDGGGAGGAI